MHARHPTHPTDSTDRDVLRVVFFRFPRTGGAVPNADALTILCIATYEKGQEFLRECKRSGHRVLLLTADKLRDADWPREAVEEFFYVPRDIGRDDLLKGISHV